MRSILGLALSLFLAAQFAFAEPPTVLPAGEKPKDARIGRVRTLNDAYHPWKPAADKTGWEKQARGLRNQILVASGLWPMLPEHPLEPRIHGKIEKEDYTIEKVYFESFPGLYVTGNLYRPKMIEGKAPGVLCPHGHWLNGRFYDAGEEGAKQQINSKAEEHESGARFPLQARMVGLARMGCVVFHYDMIGNADQKPIDHRTGFADPQAELWLQHHLLLQTYNSIRALDFISSLPEVDPDRIGVTGASGGGTQTFMLCAIDPRPAAAFPAVMVGTAMQGGCVCENASYLRIGINNIGITALFAPRPLAMSGADDWTIDIETKGLPELKQIYGYYGKEDLVHAKTYKQFPHNYNQVAREMMYAWFNKHLEIGMEEPIKERPFEPISPTTGLSVFNDAHPLPENAVDASKLRESLMQVAKEQFAALVPTKLEEMDRYRETIGTAASVMLGEGLPDPNQIQGELISEEQQDGYELMKIVQKRETGEQLPCLALIPDNFQGEAVLWIDGAGKSSLFDDKGKPTEAVRSLLKSGRAVISADLFMTGEFGNESPKVQAFAGYTFGYNRPLLAERVGDILALISGINKRPQITNLDLVGTGKAGLWVLLARARAGNAVRTTIADIQGFGFQQVKSQEDPNILPGALKYGGLGGIAALGLPGSITIFGVEGPAAEELRVFEQIAMVTKAQASLHKERLDPSKLNELLAK